MGNSQSAGEEEDDLTFEDEFDDVQRPDDSQKAGFGDDQDIDENIEGQSTINVDDIESEYEQIKDQILEAGEGFVYKDSIFPDEPTSLYYTSNPPENYDLVEWQRPIEFCESPYLLSDGISSDDIIQGMLGNCWWLSSVGAISRKPSFMRKIIPGGQVLQGEGYVGMVHFRFWRFGKWVDVIVDDLLPTINGGLCFGKSSDPNEFWLSLMEKAYSKLHGSYLSLEGGLTSDGLEDLTGGISICYPLQDKTNPNFARILHKAIKNGSFVCAGISGSSNMISTTGLVAMHAYSVLGSAIVYNERDGEKVHLVQVKNPWGGKREWNGAYSDESDDWDYVSEADKERVGAADEENGIWWMPYNDFVANFSDATICSLGPDFDEDGDPTGDSWLLTQVHGGWVAGETSGGCRNDMEAYATNPQYLLELKEPDDFDPSVDEADQEGKCTTVIGLMQENRRAGRADGLKNMYLTMNVFKVPERIEGKLDADFFRRRRPVANSGKYINQREVTLTADLLPGFYVMVPSTYKPDQDGTFLIRIFSEKGIDVEELA